jgi:hypothetical protein
MGEHGAELMRDRLGLSPPEIGRLIDAGILQVPWEEPSI